MTRYEDRTKEELLSLATEKDIKGRSTMSKDELVAALRGEAKTEVPENEPGSMTDPNNPDDPTNQDYDPDADPPDDLSVGEAPAMARDPDPDRVFGPNALPLEQR